MSLTFVMFCSAVENIILAVCITNAAIALEKWSLLWFLLLILLNRPRIRILEKDDEDEAAE